MEIRYHKLACLSGTGRAPAAEHLHDHVLPVDKPVASIVFACDDTQFLRSVLFDDARTKKADSIARRWKS
jgi:hypothetical protein